MKLTKHIISIFYSTILLILLVFTTFGYAQDRLVLPGQELLYPNLTDPSFNGEQRRTQITVLGQFVDFNNDRSTRYINAQLPIYDNLSFGVDYFSNSFDYLNYSQVLLSAAFEVPVGANGHLKIGLSGGGDSFKADRVPLEQQNPDLIPNINDNNISFTYRMGLHYNGGNVMVGGYYTTLPLQNVEVRSAQEDLLNYELSDGFTGYLGYRIGLGERFAVTPMFRYLSFTDDAIYEGSMKFQLKDKFDISIAYRNDYTINPAMRVHFLKTLALGYSYEKAIGSLSFEDIHSFSLSYKFKKANDEEEPEWLNAAKNNLARIDEIKKKKPKQKKQRSVVIEDEKIDEQAVLVAEEAPKPKVDQVKEQHEEQVLVAEENVEEKVDDSISRAIVISMAPRFYLVAKDFTDYQGAFLYKETLREKGFKAIIGSTATEAKYFVYIDSDIDKKEATKRLQTYKRSTVLKEIYLMEVKR